MIDGFKVFEPLAATFRFEAQIDEPRWSSMCVAHSVKVNVEEEPKISAPDLFLWYDNTLQPGLSALTKKLGHWLALIDIPNSSIVVNATLAVLAAKCASGVALVKALDDLARCLRQSDVSHFAPLKTNLASSWTTPLEWKGYHLGPLNLAKLVRRCQRAGSPLPSSIQSMLKGCPAIASPIFHRRMFDLRLFFLDAKTPSNAHLFAHLDWNWFRVLHHEHWNMMWADFEERRALIYALGYGLVEGDTFRKCPAIVEITCYLKIRNKPNDEGGVIFHDASHRVILPDLPESRAAIAIMDAQCDFASIEKSSLHGRLQSFAMTLNRGVRIGLEGHHSEAYVHFIIVLEQLFAKGDSISQQVAARTAALVHRQLVMSFSDCRRKLQTEHYAARSKFVHSAIPVPIHLFELIYHVTKAVLHSLLWLAKREESRSPDFFDQWLKRLDWIVAGYEAGITPPDDVLDANGIIAPDALSLP
jgi:hypothetical protein